MRISRKGIILVLLWSLSVCAMADRPLILEPVKTKIQAKQRVEKIENIKTPAQPFNRTVNYVHVKKKARELALYSDDIMVKSYRIALGKHPDGQKIKEGDSRTPEGLYTLDWRNPNSKFFRSIHVSYPNLKQSKSAREAGIDPGGEIMIHGQPSNWSERIKLTFKGPDWTEGCIALENQDMIELWNLVPDGTAIKIDP